MSIYMKIDAIKGDATAKNYQGWIELDVYNFSSNKKIINRPGSLHNRAISLPTFSQFTALKKTDRSSPLLFSNSCENKSLGTITIHNNRTSSQLEYYLEIKLYDAMLSFYNINSWDDSHENSNSEEEIRISYGKLEMKYIPRDSQNKAMSPITAGYDLQTSEIV